MCCSSWGHKDSDTTQQLNQQQRSRSRPRAVSQKGSYLQRMIELCSKILIACCDLPIGPAEGLLQLCLTLSNPMDYSPPGSSVHRILQARRLEWVAMPSSKGSSQGLYHVPCGSCLADGFFTSEPQRGKGGEQMQHFILHFRRDISTWSTPLDLLEISLT